MKLLVYLGGALLIVLALAIGGLLMAGGASGRGRNKITIDIARPAADVFPWLVEPDKRKQWIGFLKSTERVGENQVRDTIEDHGTVFTLPFSVAERSAPHRLRVNAVTPYFDMAMDHRLEEADGRTRLTLEIDTQYKMWFAKLMSPVVTRDAQKTWEEYGGKLKQLLEAR